MAIKTVEVFRKIRDEHYRILKDKPVNEQIAFYQRQAKFVRDRAGRLLKKHAASV
jgi:hypothetical protein